MRTNIEIDDKLMKNAMKLTGLSTKKEVVGFALQELINRKSQIDPRSILNDVEIDPNYDYKSLRQG